MFNRRFLRVKILQALYAYYQSNSSELNASIKELHLSISRTFDLYLYLLNLPVELKLKGEHRLEEGKKKIQPTEEDLNPHRKFVDNKLIQKVNESKKLMVFSEKHNIKWSGKTELVSKFYKALRDSDLYKTYMKNQESTYKQDRNFIVDIYKHLLPDFDLFQEAFQEKSIYWDEEDFDYAVFLVINTIKKLGSEKSLDQLLKPVYNNKDDKEFVELLFTKSINLEKVYEDLIISKAKNWDAERIALIDMILMKMALTEIVNFKEIPIKVSMNEYIDIAKSFSTPKSGQFINGIIDNVVIQLNKEKKIKKMGRGLME